MQWNSMYGAAPLMDRKNEIAALFFLGCALFLTGALYSYSPFDSSWFSYAAQVAPCHNWCGSIGSYIAALLIHLLGNAVCMVPLLLLFISYLAMSAQQRWSENWERIAAGVSGLVVAAGLLYAYRIPPVIGTTEGGYVGYILLRCAERLLGPFGGGLTLHVLLITQFVLISRVPCISMVHKVGYGIQNSLGMVYGLLQSLLHSVWRGVVRVGECAVRFYGATIGAGAITIGHMIRSRPRTRERAQENMKQSPSAFSPESSSSSSVYGESSQDEPATDYTSPTPPNFEIPSYQPKKSDTYEEPTVSEPVSAYAPLEGDEVPSNPWLAMEQEEAEQIPTPLDTRDEVAAVQDFYQLPDVSLLRQGEPLVEKEELATEEQERARLLEEKLQRFGVNGTVTAIRRGPVVTLFEYEPDVDTKISKILSLEDDLAMALRATGIRIIAPIPGRPVVGFEVANEERASVALADVIDSDVYRNSSARLPLVLGKDTIGNPVVVDLASMPHLLIAGSTGSGKSVALNTMLMSLLYRLSPDELQLILIDPKRLELVTYSDIAHLLFPIVAECGKVPAVLRWVAKQMEERYDDLARLGVRNIEDYNTQVSREGGKPYARIVVVIDELADLMMTVGREVEDLIIRIAQMARAAGIHIIAATQRPSVDVITGLMKVNFPGRIALRVASRADSRTIIDCGGADKLLGRGDMLFLDASSASLRRIHGAYVSTSEMNDVVTHIRSQRSVDYLDLDEQVRTMESVIDEDDATLLQEVEEFLRDVEEISISLLQRKFGIGYNRSARIVDMLEARGLIASSGSGKMRRVIRSGE